MQATSPTTCNDPHRPLDDRPRRYGEGCVTVRIPVPKNRLVALTLTGALLTTLVAGGLALPGLGFGQSAETPGDATGGGDDAGQLGADAPTPNENFTPAVQTKTGYEDHEDDDHEEGYEDDEDSHEDEDDEYGEYEEE